MAFYKEGENYIIRDYQLKNTTIDFYKSIRANIEIVTTELFDEMLFIDGELQLSRKDEYIYHEMLVHPALKTCNATAKNVCIIGGGDGCAAREVLRWRDVSSLTIIDWDHRLVEIFSHKYSHWNNGAFRDQRVKIEISDIRKILHQNRRYDCIIIDLLDPSNKTNENIQLWTELLKTVHRWLARDGSIVINAGSILPWKFDTVQWLLELIYLTFHNKKERDIYLYKSFVPSFTNEWCFLLIAPSSVLESEKINSTELNLFINNLRYFNDASWLMARTWTRDYCGLTGSPLIKLNTYRPPLQCVRDD